MEEASWPSPSVLPPGAGPLRNLVAHGCCSVSRIRSERLAELGRNLHRLRLPAAGLPVEAPDTLVTMPPLKTAPAYVPTGDQPGAIAELSEGLLQGDRYQTLLG